MIKGIADVGYWHDFKKIPVEKVNIDFSRQFQSMKSMQLITHLQVNL